MAITTRSTAVRGTPSDPAPNQSPTHSHGASSTSRSTPLPPNQAQPTQTVGTRRTVANHPTKTTPTGRSSSRQTARNEMMAQLMEMQVETNTKVNQLMVEIARLQKKPMDEDEVREVPIITPTNPQPSHPPATQKTSPILPREGSDVRIQSNLPIQQEVGEGSNDNNALSKPSGWQVEKFLKNGGRMFPGKQDPDAADKWLVTAKGVFKSMACPHEHRVRILTGAFEDQARVWWDSIVETCFQDENWRI